MAGRCLGLAGGSQWFPHSSSGAFSGDTASWTVTTEAYREETLGYVLVEIDGSDVSGTAMRRVAPGSYAAFDSWPGALPPPPPGSGLNYDFDFSSLPTGASHWATGGTLDPDTQVDTALGLWQEDYASDTWYGHEPGGTMASVLDELTGGVTKVHGKAWIKTTTFTNIGTTWDVFDHIVCLIKDQNYTMKMLVGFASGTLREFYSATSIAVVNTDSLEHEYGWELDLSTLMLQMYFDGSPAGSAFSVAGDPEEDHNTHFGSFWVGGSVVQDWNRWLIGEGPLPSSALAGDVNLDGTVDGLDLTLLGQNWNGTGKTWGQGDVTGDGNVDGLDLTVLGQNWGGHPA